MSEWAALRVRADWMAVAMARLLSDHRLVMQGVGTVLSTVAIGVAKAVHNASLLVYYTDGNVVSTACEPVRLCGSEWPTLAANAGCVRLSEVIWQCSPSLVGAEFIRPAQIDGFANTNNVAIGNTTRPRVRLSGASGLGEAEIFNPNVYCYVPQHSPRVLVSRVDVANGRRIDSPPPPGAGPGRARVVVTDRCIMTVADGVGTVTEVYADERLHDLAHLTGFRLRGTPCRMPPPNRAERKALDDVDPLAVRELELLSGVARLQRLREVIADEAQRWREPATWSRNGDGRWVLTTHEATAHIEVSVP
jgi:acyl CoA:acetate/3-ketoacid CoA transferase beta subunit